MNFFEKSISRLQEKRKIFHSEDDLKLSLGITIKELFPKFKIRLEQPTIINMIDINGKESLVRAPIDIIIYNENGKSIPIELKYKTKQLETEQNGEFYNLAKHGATDIGRYSFRKDIYRIEKYLSNETNSDVGFVFILTNEHNYFEHNVGHKETFDKNFTCHQNSMFEKEYKGWNYSSIDRTKYRKENNTWIYKNRKKKHWTCTNNNSYILKLRNNYPIDWKEYSKIENSEFKFCLIKIEK